MIAPAAPDSHCSTFKKVEELSQKILAKGAIARFVDKGEDSKVVARLIERLREAIMCYQVSGDWACPSGAANVRADFAATIDLSPNHPSHC